jgi:hypothetical protein
MNVPLPVAAFPIGGKGGIAVTFVVAVVIGLAIYMAQSQKGQPTSKS